LPEVKYGSSVLKKKTREIICSALLSMILGMGRRGRKLGEASGEKMGTK